MRIGRYESQAWKGLGVESNDRVTPLATSHESIIELLTDERGMLLARDVASGVIVPSGTFALSDVKARAPIERPGKVVAIGRNYREHVLEEGATTPAAPLIFGKFSTSIVGPGDEITWSVGLTREVDYEAELAVSSGGEPVWSPSKERLSTSSDTPA